MITCLNNVMCSSLNLVYTSFNLLNFSSSNLYFSKNENYNFKKIIKQTVTTVIIIKSFLKS